MSTKGIMWISNAWTNSRAPEKRAADRAVSPVIGVVLMVALTVILAGVVGIFAFGVGDQLRPAQPSTTLDISGDVSGGEPIVLSATIDHTAGDRLDKEDVHLVIRENGHTLGSVAVTELGETTYDGPDVWHVGETMTITEAEFEEVETVETDATLTLAIVHEPSESTIATGDLTNLIDE